MKCTICNKNTDVSPIIRYLGTYSTSLKDSMNSIYETETKFNTTPHYFIFCGECMVPEKKTSNLKKIKYYRGYQIFRLVVILLLLVFMFSALQSTNTELDIVVFLLCIISIPLIWFIIINRRVSRIKRENNNLSHGDYKSITETDRLEYLERLILYKAEAKKVGII